MVSGKAQSVQKLDRPWKNHSEHRSSAMVKQVRPNATKQAKLKEDLQKAKEIETRLQNERAAKRRERNELKRVKQERKKENQIRHAVKHQGAQFIKDTTKIKKWDRKARQKLVKMSPEFIDQNYGKGSR